MSTIRLALIILLGVFSLEASAGDTATPQVLGFSADGKVFAFEEHGIQDGSGFPYANRSYIDTATDSFLAGTPIRVRIDDEAADIAAARAQAKEKGDKIVGESVLAANPGDTAGWNAITEQSADPFRMVVNPRPVFPPVDSPVEFRLEEIPFARLPAAKISATPWASGSCGSTRRPAAKRRSSTRMPRSPPAATARRATGSAAFRRSTHRAATRSSP